MICILYTRYYRNFYEFKEYGKKFKFRVTKNYCNVYDCAFAQCLFWGAI